MHIVLVAGQDVLPTEGLFAHLAREALPQVALHVARLGFLVGEDPAAEFTREDPLPPQVFGRVALCVCGVQDGAADGLGQ